MALAIGIVTGIAFLCKWYPAFLVPASWVMVFWLKDNRPKGREWKHFIGQGLLISSGLLLVAGPWVWYVFAAFPNEARHVFLKFLGAYGSTVEQHSGPWHYYLIKVTAIFGEWIWLPVFSVIWGFAKQKPNSLGPWTILGVLVIVFFSMAETKRMTYLMPLAIIFFSLNGLAVEWLWQKSREKKIWLAALVVMAGLMLRFSLERAKPFDDKRSDLSMLREFDLRLAEKSEAFSTNRIVVFNHPEPIKMMFYRGGTVYAGEPSEEDIDRMHSLGLKWVVWGE